MEVSRGANLIGMSMIPLDACPLSLLIKYIYIYIYILSKQKISIHILSKNKISIPLET